MRPGLFACIIGKTGTIPQAEMEDEAVIGSVDVYKYRAAVQAYPKDAWREFEILSCATVGQLGAAVLAAFESLAYRLWYIMWNDVRYEYVFPELTGSNDDESEPVCPDFVTLRDMFLLPGDVLMMKYDNSMNWDFDIELLSIRHAEITDQYLLFPRLTAGVGGRMTENVRPQEMAHIIARQRAGNQTLEDPAFAEIWHQLDGEWTNTFGMDPLAAQFRGRAKLIELGYQDLHPEELLEISEDTVSAADCTPDDVSD